MYTLVHVEGQENTMGGQNTTEVMLPSRGDHVPHTSTDDTETTSAYLTAVYQLPVEEEHSATASLGPLGKNTETKKHEYVKGLCCR